MGPYDHGGNEMGKEENDQFAFGVYEGDESKETFGLNEIAGSFEDDPFSGCRRRDILL
eukprot:CAMPEP_0119020256 /NCGR_PEP_ID=MMETSP1176-20130426/23667_1 /TAXON_ID=265551 /ORGANISM="Synedropsis recta cf, Strain CCMP1620" /LENGTH=57 /DNA_ID=CAMNT_0006974651 /DNA_START=19 /DNA_END=192 /DNA_ORIENTATION=+